MNKSQLHKWQEKLFNIIIYVTYFLVIISSLGLSESAPKYLQSLDYYVRVYICLFLMWRFNPFRTHYEFTDLDRKIAFSAGIFLLATTIINSVLVTYVDIFKDKIQSIIAPFF
jgi:hypothetical protein